MDVHSTVMLVMYIVTDIVI